MVIPCCVREGTPTFAWTELGQNKGDLLVMGIHNQQEIVVGNGLAAIAVFQQAFPGQSHSEAARRRLLPFFVRHLTPVRRKPQHILDAGALDRPTLEKAPTTKYGMRFPHPYHAS